MRRWLGCDPGSSGAIAMIPEEGEVELYELTEDNLLSLCRDWQWDECFCAVEQVSSSPQMGVKSAFTFGDGNGFVRGVLRSHSIPFEYVKPQKWKKEFSILMTRNATTKEKKEKDLITAKRLFPNVSFRRTPRCKTDWPDAADALLIAEYGRRIYK